MFWRLTRFDIVERRCIIFIATINLLNPHFASLKTDLISDKGFGNENLHVTVLAIYMAIFFNFSSSRQVENCNHNSRLVDNEDFNCKFLIEAWLSHFRYLTSWSLCFVLILILYINLHYNVRSQQMQNVHPIDLLFRSLIFVCYNHPAFKVLFTCYNLGLKHFFCFWFLTDPCATSTQTYLMSLPKECLTQEYGH